MRVNIKKHMGGFTLIEVLLLAVVIGVVIFMSAGYFQEETESRNVDKAVSDMQQILNASLLLCR